MPIFLKSERVIVLFGAVWEHSVEAFLLMFEIDWASVAYLHPCELVFVRPAMITFLLFVTWRTQWPVEFTLVSS